MALIPNDIGIRMRLQTEAQLVQPLRPVTEIPSDVLDLRVGERFSARIQEALPNNSYKALVAGKSLTLSLPEGAKAGDTLELVVIDRSPKVVVAHLTDAPAGDTAKSAYPFTTLSRAGQLISTLLPPEGETAAPAALNRGQALLSQPPLTGSQLAPALSDAVSQSGVFYESQQARWVNGQLPLEQLIKNPQAQHSNMAVLMAARGLPESTELLSGSVQESALAGRRESPPSLLQMILGREPGGTASSNPAATPNSILGSPLAPPAGDVKAASPPPANSAAPAGNAIPDDLRPVVQQQLDALATQRLAWHGEMWPNQHVQWEIDWPQHGANANDDDETTWGTTLKLTTPRLGEVQARLQLTPAGVRVSIATPIGATAADLREAAPLLEQSLAAANVPLIGFVVKHDAE